MDNNLDQLLFSESNGNNNSEQPKTQQNERIAYENIDPLEILIRITQKAKNGFVLLARVAEPAFLIAGHSSSLTLICV